MRQSFSDVTKNNANVGLRVGEREDFMTEKIREYNAPNGSMIIGIDNGYGNMKSARRCFPIAVTKYDSEPVLSRDYIEYEGSYYVIGEGHKGKRNEPEDKQCENSFGSRAATQMGTESAKQL